MESNKDLAKNICKFACILVTKNGGYDYPNNPNVDFLDNSIIKDLKDLLFREKFDSTLAEYISESLIRYFGVEGFEFNNPELFDDLSEQVKEEIESTYYKKSEANRSVTNKKGSKNMEKKTLSRKVVDTALEDASEIGIRLGAKQLAKGVQEPLVNLLIQGFQLEDNPSIRNKIAAFLNTEFGFGIISMACSFGVQALPLGERAKPVLERLSKELRWQGEMAVTEPVVELLMTPLRSLLTQQVLQLPIPGLQPALEEKSQVVETFEVKEVSSVPVKSKKKNKTK